MNAWTLAAIALAFGYLPAGVIALRGGPMERLVGVQLAGALSVGELCLLSEALSRPGFVDLAIVLAVLALPSGLTFARLMERWT